MRCLRQDIHGLSEICVVLTLMDKETRTILLNIMIIYYKNEINGGK